MPYPIRKSHLVAGLLMLLLSLVLNLMATASWAEQKNEGSPRTFAADYAVGEVFKCGTDFISEKDLKATFLISGAGHPRIEFYNQNNLFVAACDLKIDYLKYNERAATAAFTIYLDNPECIDAHGKSASYTIVREDTFLRFTPSDVAELPTAYLLIFDDLQPSKCFVSKFNEKKLKSWSARFEGAR